MQRRVRLGLTLQQLDGGSPNRRPAAQHARPRVRQVTLTQIGQPELVQAPL
jgi:hypothetical protein